MKASTRQLIIAVNNKIDRVGTAFTPRVKSINPAGAVTLTDGTVLRTVTEAMVFVRSIDPNFLKALKA